MKDTDVGGMELSDLKTSFAFFKCTVIVFFFVDFGLTGWFVCLCSSLRQVAFSTQPQSMNLLFNPNPIESCRKEKRKHLTPKWPTPETKGHLAVPALGFRWTQRGAGVPVPG